MRTNRSHVVGLFLATAIAVSACGSDSDPQSAEAAADAAPTAADEPAETTAPAATEAPDDDEKHDDDEHDDDDHDDDHDDEKHDDDDDHDDDEHDDDHDDEKHDDDHDDEHDHDEGSSGLGAHEHGTAELSVAWIGNEVSIDMISPTFNVFGFEYEPTTDEDVAIEADRTAALTASGVISINDAAACSLSGPVETEIERDGTHSEITASWLFACDNPDEIAEVDLTPLFAEFPSFEDIDAQWISDSEQSSAELSPSESTLSLRG